MIIEKKNEDSDNDETADINNIQNLDEACTSYEKLMSGNICAEKEYSSNALEKIKGSSVQKAAAHVAADRLQCWFTVKLRNKKKKNKRESRVCEKLHGIDILLYVNLSEQNAQETGSYTCSPSKPCFHT